MEQQIPESLQSEILFLLIGMNPLPNYVAAHLLIKNGGRLYLLCSETTCKYAEKIIDLLITIRPDVKAVPITIDEVNNTVIEKRVGELIEGLPSNTKVGLHYTGGTKPMSTHVYRRIEKQFPGSLFSYLDHRRLELVIDGKGSEPRRCISLDNLFQIDLVHLLRLHGLEIKEIEKRPLLLDACKVLAELMPNHAPEWREWCDRNLRGFSDQHLPRGWKERADDLLTSARIGCSVDPTQKNSFREIVRDLLIWAGKEDARSTKQLQGVSLPVGPPLNVVTACLAGDLEDPRLEIVSVNQGFMSLREFGKWLDGGWVEHYTLNCLQKIANQCRLHEVALNLTPTGAFNFEFDVVALRDYQLFAISCTSDVGKRMNKSKLFEVFARARQMGGDETRFALVGGYSEPTSVQRELVEDLQTSKQMVKVFGAAHFPDLADHLASWIEKANQI